MQAVRTMSLKLCVLATLMALFFIAGCQDEAVEAPPVIRPVKVIEVGALEQGLSRAFPGQVIANETAELAFRVSGQIKKWPITEGQNMKKGALVAQLDQRDYKTALERAQSQLAGAVAARKNAEDTYKRGEKLLPSGAIAQATFDEMQANFETAKAREATVKQEIRKAKLDLEYTTLRAPFDGIVSAKYVDNFQNVQAQQPVIKFENLDAVDIVIEIPEFVWGRLSRTARSGEKVTRSIKAYFDSHPDVGYDVALKEYQTTANPETQTYSVRLTMPQPKDFTAYPGMTAKIRAELVKVETEGYSVPVQAVFGGNDGTKYVWIIGDDMKAAKQKVTTGEMAGSDIAIPSGLKGGEKVVIAGVNTLLEGQEVSFLGSKE